jgi:hypothetical protein
LKKGGGIERNLPKGKKRILAIHQTFPIHLSFITFLFFSMEKLRSAPISNVDHSTENREEHSATTTATATAFVRSQPIEIRRSQPRKWQSSAPTEGNPFY